MFLNSVILISVIRMSVIFFLICVLSFNDNTLEKKEKKPIFS